jgi:hypothetical protein
MRIPVVALYALSVLLAGCQTPAPKAPAVPTSSAELRAGPLIDLLSAKTSHDRLKAVADPAGRVHVLIASDELHQVLEVIVGPKGVLERRVVRTGVSPASIDSAFDERGRLHALIGTEHMVFENGAWRTSPRTPWGEAGVKAEQASFVPGAPRLIWAFKVNGAVFGAPGRVEVYGGGGYGGWVWPWFTHGTRTVLVAESGDAFGPWLVLDPLGKEDSDVRGIAADAKGNVQVLYTRARGGMASGGERRYAFIRAGLFASAAAGGSGRPEARAGAIRFVAIEGQPAQTGAFIAVDPESGTALAGMRWIVQGERWTGPLALPITKAAHIDVVPAGGDAFHAMVIGEPRDSMWGKGFPVQYLKFSGKTWSAPFEVGLADEASFWGQIWDALGLAGVKSGAAFLAWPTERGIVGCWVEPRTGAS